MLWTLQIIDVSRPVFGSFMLFGVYVCVGLQVCRVDSYVLQNSSRKIDLLAVYFAFVSSTKF